eukprot:2995521-Rhodomonas_salina.1
MKLAVALLCLGLLAFANGSTCDNTAAAACTAKISDGCTPTKAIYDEAMSTCFKAAGCCTSFNAALTAVPAGCTGFPTCTDNVNATCDTGAASDCLSDPAATCRAQQTLYEVGCYADAGCCTVYDTSIAVVKETYPSCTFATCTASGGDGGDEGDGTTPDDSGSAATRGSWVLFAFAALASTFFTRA